jgi:pleiotropic regulator 1
MEAALAKSTRGGASFFAGDDPHQPPPPPVAALKAKVASKLGAFAKARPAPGAAPTGCSDERERRAYVDELAAALSGARRRKRAKGAKVDEGKAEAATGEMVTVSGNGAPTSGARALSVPLRRKAAAVPVPQWHAPWALKAVCSGHLGWVRCVAFDPQNEWFVTGSADRTIKVWDLAKCSAGAQGGLKRTLTGHVGAVRGIAVSPRSAYAFSAGDDKKVLCWDLETNKVVRRYHGHLSGVYCLVLHPTLDLVFTGGRDSCVRCWDQRTSKQVMMLGGHQATIQSVAAANTDPQVVSGSADSTVRLWDLAAGKTRAVLTHHKRGIRAVACAPFDNSFVSAAADACRTWRRKDGALLRTMRGHNAVLNSCDINSAGVMATAGDDGSLRMWDYRTGYNLQRLETVAQPGSLACEAGIYDCAFDRSGTRLITCEADKSVKIWKEQAEADPESHPIDMEAWTKECRRRR